MTVQRRGGLEAPGIGNAREGASEDERRLLHAGRLSPAALNLTRLRYFVAVAQELHFGRAASRLGISQPPLTTHIQALELQVGAKLFTRTKRMVSLTAAGRLLLAEATQLLDHAERVTHVMQGLRKGELGSLFLGCVPFGLFSVLPAIARAFRLSHPGVSLVVTEGHTTEIITEVAEDRLDFGLVWKNVNDRRLGTCPVLEGRFIAALPADHFLLEVEELSLEDLALQPLILPSRKISPYHYDQILAAFTSAGMVPRIEYEVPMILSQLGFVASGFGIAITPSFAKRFTGLGVEFREIKQEMPPVLLSLIWSTRQISDSVARFIDVVMSLRGELN
jgi:DNA-binding transcriptional LysR family regulator